MSMRPTSLRPRRATAPRCRSRRVVAALAIVGLAVLGCGGSEEGAAAGQHQPEALADQEGAVCGMLIRNQSAPRAQVVHRDGERAFLCSLGDLLVHLGAPSPHGSVGAAFVEVMDPSQDPLASHTGEHDWMPAAEASYVIGVERRGIMGAPVLAYASVSAANAVAARHDGARVLDFDALATWWRERQAAR